MRIGRFIFLLQTLGLGLLILSTTVHAGDGRFSILHHRYLQNKNDFINSFGTIGLKEHSFQFGTSLEFLEKPIEFIRSDTSGKIQSINRLVIQHLNADYGFSKKWSFGMNLPIVWFNSYRPPEAVNHDLDTKRIMGDLFFHHRFIFSDRSEAKWGFALMNFFTLPTGNENFFMGYKSATGGLSFIIDKNISTKFSFGFNFGFDLHTDHEVLNIDHNSHFVSSLGLIFSPWETFDIKTNLKLRTPFSEFLKTDLTTQTETYIDLGVKSKSQKWRFYLLGGFPIVKGVGVPVFRSQLGVSYHFKNRETKK